MAKENSRAGGEKTAYQSGINILPSLNAQIIACRRNHLLPTEAGVWSQVYRDMRLCKFCKTDIVD